MKYNNFAAGMLQA